MQQIVPPIGQRLSAGAETGQSEVKPWSELSNAPKRRRSDVTDYANGVSAVNNTPLAQTTNQVSSSTAMQPGKLTQQVFSCQYQ
jgi:hypothetical protein